MKLAETATKRVTDAVADVADVLTPAQRADLGQRSSAGSAGSAANFPAFVPPHPNVGVPTFGHDRRPKSEKSDFGWQGHGAARHG